MATHELYLGGPGRFNASRGMFPAAAFDNADPVFQKMPVAAHKGPVCFANTRTLDSTNHALANYLADNPVAAADVLNLQVVTAASLLLGLRVRVEKPVPGLTLTFGLDDGTTFGTAVDCSVESDGFVAPNGAAWVTDSAVSLATAEFAVLPRMLQATVTAIGAAGLSGLRIHVSPVVIETEQGQP